MGGHTKGTGASWMLLVRRNLVEGRKLTSIKISSGEFLIARQREKYKTATV